MSVINLSIALKGHNSSSSAIICNIDEILKAKIVQSWNHCNCFILAFNLYRDESVSIHDGREVFQCATNDLQIKSTFYYYVQKVEDLSQVVLKPLSDLERLELDYKNFLRFDLTHPLTLYYSGIVLEKNGSYRPALECYKKAAAQGVGDAEARIGTYYIEGLGVEKNLNLGLQYLNKAFEKGSILAMTTLGTCYLEAIGVKKDKQKAFLFFHIAAEKGNPLASFQLGYCYMIGSGVEKDFSKALNWFIKAHEKNNIRATYFLGKSYQHGLGVKKNLPVAFDYFISGVSKNCNDCLYEIANCYYYGKGLKQNYSLAVKLYQRLANLGMAEAQNDLAHCYMNGLGIKKDINLALNLYSKAALQKNRCAILNLAMLFAVGKDVQKNTQIAIKLLLTLVSKDKNDFNACFYLFKLLKKNSEFGQQPNDNNEIAFKWLVRAAEGGHEEAKRLFEYYNTRCLKNSSLKKRLRTDSSTKKSKRRKFD